MRLEAQALPFRTASMTPAPGTVRVSPEFAALFARLGLTTASDFLDLPGEVVGGHPDRHVVRVELPGAPHAFYLKRQHVVGWRERLRNALLGFGPVSRCEREAATLGALEAAGLPAPKWVAFGAHGARAFLIVEEVPCGVELRRLLSDNSMSHRERRALAANVGRAIAAVHAAGFTTPDLTAKHVLVNPKTLAVTFLDWQNTTRGEASEPARVDALSALHASLAEALATPRERLRVLAAYCERPGLSRLSATPNTAGMNLAAHRILRAAQRHAGRRSVRDQLPVPADSRAQRLVWLAGEAVCVVPELADAWPRPAVGPPFYGGPEGTFPVRFAGRERVLVRGQTFAPVGRFRAWWRAAPWRSTGVTAGRVLFHLERHGIPAPRLLAFGQRLTGLATAEWFALYESPRGAGLLDWLRTASGSQRRALLPALLDCVAKLHAAGCVLVDAGTALGVDGSRGAVTDPRAVLIVRRVSNSARRRDVFAVQRLLGVE